jgi:hypothetical protein
VREKKGYSGEKVRERKEEKEEKEERERGRDTSRNREIREISAQIEGGKSEEKKK